MSQRITITLPDEVYRKVKESAERDFRTIGAEIAYLLHLHVPAYKDTALDSEQITPRVPTTPTPSMFIPHDAPGGLHHATSTPENPTGQDYTPTTDITGLNHRTII